MMTLLFPVLVSILFRRLERRLINQRQRRTQDPHLDEENLVTSTPCLTEDREVSHSYILQYFTDTNINLVGQDFSGPPREELPIPTVPPFTAFVGNLTFETDDEAVKEHLGPGITSVRLVKDQLSGKPKGYGYVEYGSQGDLKTALGKNMSSLGGRTIRVSVAEARTLFLFFRRGRS